MGNNLLAPLRRGLKNILYVERATEWSDNGYVPVCAVCGKPPTHGAMQMHETLISRGDVRGNESLTLHIMRPYNCVLVHNECHEHAESEEGKRACARNILKHEKYEDVISWLNKIQMEMRTEIPQEAIRLINEVNNEL